MNGERRLRYPLQVHLSTVFLTLILIVGLALGGVAYRKVLDVIENMSADIMGRVATEASLATAALYGPAESAVDLMAATDIGRATDLAGRRAHLRFLVAALNQSPNITAVFIGTEEGDFLLVRRLPTDKKLRAKFDAPDGTAYVVQSIDRRPDGSADGRYLYFSSGLRLLGQSEKPDYVSYDPRKRPWYGQALSSEIQVKTAPYVFYTTREVGTTLARALLGGSAVVAADITLNTLSQTLAGQRVTPGSEAVLLSASGSVIAHSDAERGLLIEEENNGVIRQSRIGDLGAPALERAFDAWKAGDRRQVSGLRTEVRGKDWRMMAAPVVVRGSESYVLALAIPDRELLASAYRILIDGAAWVGGLLVVAAVLIFWVSRMISNPIRALVREADRIRRFELQDTPEIHTIVSDVDDLAAAVEGMKGTIRRFLDITSVVAATEDFDQLLDRLLVETVTTTRTEGGAIYLLDVTGNHLDPKVARTSTGTLVTDRLDRLSACSADSMICQSVSQRKGMSGTVTAESGAAMGIGPLYDAIEEPPRYLLVVPLLNRKRELLGVLLLLESQEMDPALLGFTEALSGTAAISLEARQLIAAQKELFDSFIRLIAGAIDAKSAYTGGHCARVPELTQMLADAAHRTVDGPFAGFTLGDDDREAIRVASWLHDCGKVTTPEYVVDKATKLETIYDRLHEVRMRFEVIKRDVQVAFWKEVAAGRGSPELEAETERTLAELDDDFTFVAQCNEGGEFMDAARIERLKKIAERTWLRTLDDRIGLSHEEKARKAQVAAQTLPVVEPLLADKPEHIFERPERERIPPDNPWGFRMQVPEYLYNRGELYNLSVGRGTLTEEERYKINEHIIQSVVMLSQLPFPRHLRTVPELAGGHHEKMDGTGYPKRLKRDEMSPVARMMVIADVFEALTAVDRPYKKGKTLSEALRIMSFMVKDQHVDPDLFDLFLVSGAYRDYAERFMQPGQIDEVDIEKFRPRPAA